MNSLTSKPAAPLNLKLVPIGNSQGVRLPKALLQAYGLGTGDGAMLLAESRPEGILLRAPQPRKLSLADTFADMAREQEDWSDLETTSGDGLSQLPW